MNEIRKIIEDHLKQVDDLMDFLESSKPRDRKANRIANKKLDVLKTSLEKHEDTHEAFSEALVHLKIYRGSHPKLSQWHRMLYDVEISLSWWLEQFDD